MEGSVMYVVHSFSLIKEKFLSVLFSSLMEWLLLQYRFQPDMEES
jgi:hypothetical protein